MRGRRVSCVGCAPTCFLSLSLSLSLSSDETVDTDRHWLSLHDIRRIIDALGYAKLNILHWHSACALLPGSWS